ncbi:MAG: OsmC family protein [Deltaproteobacteria bacterium]|nr:OsmC family protein [Deltaproteobacteria bacterium]MBW2695561.1 OsmC family protein [Deltaproteobacteria bacterium]
MVEVQVVYEGALHSECRHGPSGASLATDAPVDNHGKGESFSPTDLVATGLGTCMLTVMGIVAERHGWPLVGTTVRVEKHMAMEPVRRIGRLVVELRFPPGIPGEAREILERTAHTCPVRQSLHPDIDVDVSFTWGGLEES